VLHSKRPYVYISEHSDFAKVLLRAVRIYDSEYVRRIAARMFVFYAIFASIVMCLCVFTGVCDCEDTENEENDMTATSYDLV